MQANVRQGSGKNGTARSQRNLLRNTHLSDVQGFPYGRVDASLVIHLFDSTQSLQSSSYLLIRRCLLSAHQLGLARNLPSQSLNRRTIHQLHQ